MTEERREHAGQTPEMPRYEGGHLEFGTPPYAFLRKIDPDWMNQLVQTSPNVVLTVDHPKEKPLAFSARFHDSKQEPALLQMEFTSRGISATVGVVSKPEDIHNLTEEEKKEKIRVLIARSMAIQANEPQPRYPKKRLAGILANPLQGEPYEKEKHDVVGFMVRHSQSLLEGLYPDSGGDIEVRNNVKRFFDKIMTELISNTADNLGSSKDKWETLYETLEAHERLVMIKYSVSIGLSGKEILHGVKPDGSKLEPKPEYGKEIYLLGDEESEYSASVTINKLSQTDTSDLDGPEVGKFQFIYRRDGRVIAIVTADDKIDFGKLTAALEEESPQEQQALEAFACFVTYAA